MTMIQYHIPSKTFLLGEYLVLMGGPAIVMNTTPYFIFEAKLTQQTTKNPFAAESPAGKLYHDHADFFKQYQIHFTDPHKGKGGFGGSTAEFLGLYALKEQKPINKIPALQLLETYRKYARHPDGLPPSGIDLMGQRFGKMLYFSQQTQEAAAIDWPFDDLSCLLIRTNNKLPTHEHLQNLSPFPAQDMELILEKALYSLANKTSQAFIDCIHAYRHVLQQLNYIAPKTQELLQQFDQIPEILAAKGCGALGAEVMAVFCKNIHVDTVKAFSQKMQLEVISSQKELAPPL